MLWLIRNLRRNRLAKRPFPDTWEQPLARFFPWAQGLPSDEALRFRTHLKVFVWEKHWIGAHDLLVTDEMKVAVAGAAARLVRNLSLHTYDRLTELVIYPSHYRHPDNDAVIYGEAHHWGTVVLSWDAVRGGIAIPNDGHDTALHELAHVLDVVDGTFDGTPELADAAAYRQWAHVLSKHFLRLRARPHRNVLRAYGATNEAEFFAVATEAFFEKPAALARKAPDLFKTLVDFYRLDPRV